MNTKHEVFTKEVAKDIIDIFENLLDEKDISIPDEDRNGDNDEARIYGMVYDKLLTNVEDLIIRLMQKCENNYKSDTWNNGSWLN